MEMIFCRRCGSALANVENHVYQCENDHVIFANCSPTVGVFFVTPDGDVLLSERGIEPRKGMLDAFGGFVDGEESLEKAVERELEEELGLQSSDYEELRFLCSEVGHYPYRNETLPVLSTLFWTRLTSSGNPIASYDVAAIRKIPLHEVDLSQLHDVDIRTGIQKLQQIFSDKSL